MTTLELLHERYVAKVHEAVAAGRPDLVDELVEAHTDEALAELLAR